MTKLLLSTLACLAIVASTSSVFANNEPAPQQDGQQNNPQANEANPQEPIQQQQ